ncbi:MAG: peptidoglycan-binding protein [Patescibacteria group bacterium]
MLKKIAFAGVGIALLASPLIASADVISDLQAKIRELIAQVQQLKGQLPAPDVTPMPIGRICPQILRTLEQGITGSDVKELQAYFGVTQTGYFGPMTARAVAAFQAEEGLSQVGIVGPMTRAAFARRCGWNQTFTASPTSGPAPLLVTFDVSRRATDVGYSIDFGDGQSGPLSHAGLQSHTYTSKGAYTAKLIYQAPAPACNAPEGAACTMVLPPARVVGTATITVRDSTPNCPIYNAPLCTDDQQLVGDGVGADGCQLGPRCVPKTPTTPGAPTINGIDGPAALGAGATGLWTVRASVPNNTNTSLRYSVIWGDEGVLDQIRAFGNAAAGVLQTTGTFTHAYARAGTYRPTFTVSNTFGSAQTSASVVVGGGGTDACTAMYRVCPAGTHNGGRCDQDCIPDGTSSTFSASPTSGAAPLTVAFRTPAGDEESFSVAFGDGVSGAMSVIEGGAARGVSHTYTANGTYTATLTKFTTSACAAGLCATTQVLGTVTITVGGTVSSGTLSATPKEGAAPLMVTFSGVGNSISFGDGSPILFASGNANLGTLTHVYRTYGEYKAESGNASVNISVDYGKDRLASFGGAFAPALCVYNNRTYASGATADVPVRACGRGDSIAFKTCFGAASQAGGSSEIVSQRYTCTNGEWVDQYGGYTSSEPVSATSCRVLGGMTVFDGQMVAQSSFAAAVSQFDYLTAFRKPPSIKCVRGEWFQCDTSGNNCTMPADAPSVIGYEAPVAASGANPNIANALTALESAIRAFIANLGQ